MPHKVRVGLEQILDDPPQVLQGARLGLVMNQASVDSHFQYDCDLIARRFPGQLAALFSPQHGLWCEEQANMIESGHHRYAPLDLPVYSLYSETRRPTTEMLRGIDCLLIDLQDVGTRVYTFIWTMREALRVCAEQGIPIVVLDRPNPLGGTIVEGPMLEAGFQSFVGEACIPLRHGLTIGELARLFNQEENLGAQLHVVPMSGWRRDMLWADTGRVWVAPSPNMPRVETTLLYPGQVLLEGTNLSEGRGTTLPFERCGTPWLEEQRLVAALERYEFPGITLCPIRFRPTFDKWRGETCRGLAVHIDDPHSVRSVSLTLAFIAEAAVQAPDRFAWLQPPYEYEYELPPIDILFGSARFRLAVALAQQGMPIKPDELTAFSVLEWEKRVRSIRLY